MGNPKDRFCRVETKVLYVIIIMEKVFGPVRGFGTDHKREKTGHVPQLVKCLTVDMCLTSVLASQVRSQPGPILS